MSKPKAFAQIETTQQFRQMLLLSLSKLADSDTIATAHTEVRELMQVHIVNTERMNCFLASLSESNEYMKGNQKKEYVKLYGEAAAVFEEALGPFLSKIMGYIGKRLKDNDQSLQVPCSDAVGMLVHHCLKNLETIDDQLASLKDILKSVCNLLNQPDKKLQTGAAHCFQRLIQNSPPPVLIEALPNLSEKLLHYLQSSKAKGQILETIISLAIAIEENFEAHAVSFLPLLLEQMGSSEWATRKLAIDVVYTFAAIVPNALIPFKQEITDVLNQSRFDKYKPVREATLEALQAVKKIGGGKYELEEQKEKSPSRGKSSRSTIREHKEKFKNDQAPKKLSTATQKRLESKSSQKEMTFNDSHVRSSFTAKSSIFEGPVNESFFSKAKQSSDVTVTDQSETQVVKEEDIPKESNEDDIGIVIYEGRKTLIKDLQTEEVSAPV